MLDILVVAYRAREYLAQCLQTIALHTAEGFRLTVYDNRPKNYPLTWIWNRFMEDTRREYVALVNPDVLVGPGWDTEAVACLSENPSCSSVNPVTNWYAHHEVLPRWVPDSMSVQDIPAVHKALQAAAAPFPRFYFKKSRAIASGHCLITRRATWAALGKFDEERYPFVGSDEEFHDRAMAAGMVQGVCTRAFVFHYGNRSVKEASAIGEIPPGPNPHEAVRPAPPPTDGSVDFREQAVPAEAKQDRAPAPTENVEKKPVQFTFAEDIFSTVTRKECARLAELAKGGTVLELGAGFGRSTIALASVARRVHSVDWHKGDNYSGQYDSLGGFLFNAKRLEVEDKIVSFVGRNEIFLPAFKGLFSYDLVFIDSYCAPEAVELDVRLARPLVRPGGVLAVHDYGDIPNLPPGFVFGVTEAVNALVGREKARLEVCQTLGIVHLP